MHFWFCMIILGRSSLSNSWKFGAFGYDGEGLRTLAKAYDCQSWVCLPVLSYPFNVFLNNLRWCASKMRQLMTSVLILTLISYSHWLMLFQSTCWKVLQARSKVGLARGGGLTREHEGSLEIASSAGTLLSDVVYLLLVTVFFFALLAWWYAFWNVLIIQPMQNLVMQHVDHSAGDLIDLLQGLLRYDPNERLKAREALRHPFFTRCIRRCGFWGYTEIENPNAAFLHFDV